MPAPTNARYHIVPYPDTINRATAACHSNCGPIQLSFHIGRDNAPQTIFFRPDSPVFNVLNSSAGGHQIIPLAGVPQTRDLIAATFTNTTRSEGSVTLLLAFHAVDSVANQEVLNYEEPHLAAGSSVTVHIVVNRPPPP